MMAVAKRNTKIKETKTVRAMPARLEQLTKLLSRKNGATIPQLQKAFGWKPHSARAAISTLRKIGLCVERTPSDKGSVYRIVGDA